MKPMKDKNARIVLVADSHRSVRSAWDDYEQAVRLADSVFAVLHMSVNHNCEAPLDKSYKSEVVRSVIEAHAAADYVIEEIQRAISLDQDTTDFDVDWRLLFDNVCQQRGYSNYLGV